MTPVEFAILGLACWRISHLFVQESGPFGVFQKLREHFGIKHDETGRPYQYPDGFFPQLFSCVWCISIWVAVLSIAYWFFPTITIILASVPALSAAAIVVNHFVSDV